MSWHLFLLTMSWHSSPSHSEYFAVAQYMLREESLFNLPFPTQILHFVQNDNQLLYLLKYLFESNLV